MKPSFPAVALFLLFLAGFLVSGALTPSVSGSAEELPEGSGPPPSLPFLLPYGSGNWEQANESESKELVVAAVDLSDDSSLPEQLPDFDYGRGPGSRSLLCSDLVKHNGFLLASSSGTIFAMDSRSRVPYWKLSIGSRLSYSDKADRDLDYYIYSDDDGRLWEYNKAFGHREFDLTIEESVLRLPHSNGSTVVLGSKVDTAFYLDNNGIIIRRIGSAVEENVVSSELETSKGYILLLKTDYSLHSSYLGTTLWHVTVSRLTAKCVPSIDVGDVRVPSAQSQGEIPVLFLPKVGNNMLPPASNSHNPRPLGPGTTIERSVPVPVDMSNDMSPCSDISRDLSIKANNSLVENSPAAKQKSTEMLPGAMHGIIALLMIPSLLIFLALCYMKFREPVKYDKQSNNLGGRQSLVPKKRKARKAGNMKNGATIGNYGKHMPFEKENAEANGHIHIHSNELCSYTNLITSVDAGDGRWVGKLFVSNSEIGRGSNGTVVFQGVYDGRPVAVKRLLRAHHDFAFKEIQNLIASDHHPNIVRWYGFEQDLDFVYISLERCTCSLSDLIQLCSDSSLDSTLPESSASNSVNKHNVRLDTGKGIEKDLELWTGNGFPSSQLLKLMRDIVSGLAHLHELGIIHRDMKPQNVLISNVRHLNAKLSDMGISKRLLEDMSSLSQHATGYGSSGWQAPEQLLHGRQTRAMDLFSLGCILFFCITKGKHPFGNYFERDSNILNNRVDLFLVDHIPEAVHLLSQLLDPNPKMRPNAVEVLCHPLFWSSEMRLTFLRDTSDRIELEDRENESELLKALENVAPVAFGGKWGEKLDTAFITDMGRYRKYNFDCMRDLLRVIRNKLNHYRELPKELQQILGPVPEGFDRYFSGRFPKLLIEVYKVICRYCREDDCFSKYFMTTVP